MREHIGSSSSSAARPGGAAGRRAAARLSDELRHEASHVTEPQRVAKDMALHVVQLHASAADIDAMTQQNAALVEPSSAASLSLRQQAGQLRQVPAAFRLAPARPL